MSYYPDKKDKGDISLYKKAFFSSTKSTKSWVDKNSEKNSLNGEKETCLNVGGCLVWMFSLNI